MTTLYDIDAMQTMLASERARSERRREALDLLMKAADSGDIHELWLAFKEIKQKRAEGLL